MKQRIQSFDEFINESKLFPNSWSIDEIYSVNLSDEEKQFIAKNLDANNLYTLRGDPKDGTTSFRKNPQYIALALRAIGKLVWGQSEDFYKKNEKKIGNRSWQVYDTEYGKLLQVTIGMNDWLFIFSSKELENYLSNTNQLKKIV